LITNAKCPNVRCQAAQRLNRVFPMRGPPKVARLEAQCHSSSVDLLHQAKRCGSGENCMASMWLNSDDDTSARTFCGSRVHLIYCPQETRFVIGFTTSAINDHASPDARRCVYKAVELRAVELGAASSANRLDGQACRPGLLRNPRII